jgi:hypothetical protein
VAASPQHASDAQLLTRRDTSDNSAVLQSNGQLAPHRQGSRLASSQSHALKESDLAGNRC